MQATLATRRSIPLRDELDLGSFTLVIGAGANSGERIAAAFREYVTTAFETANPLLANYYDLVIEEGEVWTGSRKSRNKIKLRKKKVRTVVDWFKKSGVILMTSLNLLAIDPDVVKHNLGHIITTAEQVFTGTAADVTTEDRNIRFDESIFHPPPPPPPPAGRDTTAR